MAYFAVTGGLASAQTFSDLVEPSRMDVMNGAPFTGIVSLLARGLGHFGAAFGPVIILSLFWPAMTRNGALAGILVSAVTVVVWKQGCCLGLYEIIPCFFFAALATLVVSRMGQASSAMRKNHQAVEMELRTALA